MVILHTEICKKNEKLEKNLFTFISDNISQYNSYDLLLSIKIQIIKTCPTNEDEKVKQILINLQDGVLPTCITAQSNDQLLKQLISLL